MFDLFLNTPLCSKHVNNYFHQIYLSDTNLMQKTSYYIN